VVAWDGLALVIAWRQEEDERVPSNAGLVAQAVLEEAAEKVGASIYVQRCSAHCE
jgi:hypothetical protein